MKIPNALRVDLTDDAQGQSQFVETRIIDPVAGADQRHVRFLLPKEGILDSDAFISFKVKGANADSKLPLHSGAMSAFSTATLFSGGKQVAQSRGLNHLWTLKNWYRDPHNRNHKQAKRVCATTGICVAPTAVAPANTTGTWGMDVTQDWAYQQAAGNVDVTTDYKITNDLETTPEMTVFLSELFPLLYQNQLPLGLLQEQMSIELELQEELVRGDRAVSGAALWVAGTTYEEFKLHVDLVFYDDPINSETTMERLQKKLNAGTVLPFTDYAYVRQEQIAQAAGRQEVNIMMGLDNQVVRRIFMATPEKPTYGAPTTSGNALLGNYASEGSSQNNTLQVTVNALPVYVSPLDTDGKIQNQLNQCMPTPHKINPAMASYIGQVDGAGAVVNTSQRMTTDTCEGVAMTALCGSSHYYGVPLMKSHANSAGQGLRVGRNPVIVNLTDLRNATHGAAKEVHCWAECERLLSMKNGMVMVSGA